MAPLENRLDLGWWALRIGLGLGPIVAGVDKYFNFLTDWSMYLSPLAARIVPVTPATFMHAVGVVEMLAGLLVLSRWTKLGSYIVMFWLLAIAANLVASGIFLDLAVRDVEMAIGAFALAQLSTEREQRENAERIANAVPGSSIVEVG